MSSTHGGRRPRALACFASAFRFLAVLCLLPLAAALCAPAACAGGWTEQVSVSSSGEQGNGTEFIAVYQPAISADGRFVAFSSYASNLVPGDTNGVKNIFVHDRQAGVTERVSVGSAGEQGDGDSLMPNLDPSGRFIIFESRATTLVPGDTNGGTDVFIRTRWGFRDVFSSYWAYGQINACVAANVVKGYEDATYRPDLQVTRDQMAVYVSRSLVIPSGDAAIPDPVPPATFSDVDSTHWAYKHIEYAVSQNVVKGYSDGTYKPDLVVDRGQMAVFVARAMVTPSGDAGIPDAVPPYQFPDVPGTDSTWAWCLKHVEYLAGLGIVKGYQEDSGYFYHPERAVTRDQMAVYVARAFKLLL